MLHATKGVVYSHRPYFEAVWGGTPDEFHARLELPDNEVDGFVKGNLRL